MTDEYAVSLPYAADVSLLTVFSGSKAQLGSMLTGKNKLRNVALDVQGGELSAGIFLSGVSPVLLLLPFAKAPCRMLHLTPKAVSSCSFPCCVLLVKFMQSLPSQT